MSDAINYHQIINYKVTCNNDAKCKDSYMITFLLPNEVFFFFSGNTKVKQTSKFAVNYFVKDPQATSTLMLISLQINVKSQDTGTPSLLHYFSHVAL